MPQSLEYLNYRCELPAWPDPVFHKGFPACMHMAIATNVLTSDKESLMTLSIFL